MILIVINYQAYFVLSIKGETNYIEKNGISKFRTALAQCGANDENHCW